VSLTTIERSAERYAPHLLSILRIMSALVLLQHPLSKFLGWPAKTMPAMFSLPWFAGVIELVFGVLLLVGLYTRASAFVLSGLMAFAYFIGHAHRGFYPILNGGNPAILYCFIFLYLAFRGGGPWSLDALRGRR
jgi:putative oxidoreductase